MQRTAWQQSLEGAGNSLWVEWTVTENSRVGKSIKKPDRRMGRYRDNLSEEGLGTGDDSSKGHDVQGMNNTRNARSKKKTSGTHQHQSLPFTKGVDCVMLVGALLM